MEYSAEEMKGITDKLTLAFRRWRFGTKAQLAFLEDLYTLINDGIPANRAVEMMSKLSTGMSKEVATALTEKIGEGQPLAEGMRGWFAPNVIEIIRIGETGGALAQTLKSAINMLAQSGVAMGSFIGAIAYPAVVIIMACAIIIYLNTSVFDQFRAMKPEDQWPEAGRRLVAVGNFVQYWWWSFILGVFAIGWILRWLMINYVGEMRSILDKYPPFMFYKQLAAARLMETLGLLVSNGVVFRAAIKVMQHQANPYMGYHLAMMEYLLSTGKTNIGEVLNTGLVNDQDLMRLRVMAEVKGFEHGLIRMGIRGTEQATATLKTIAKIFGGILLLIGGVLIILIVQGIFMTGMSMGQQ